MLAFDSYMGEADSPPIAFDPGSAKFELTLQMWEGRDRIGGFFEYRTDLFAPEAIAKFATAFVLLLRNAIQEPSKEVARLATIPEDERSRLLYARNATAMEFPRDRTIHQLFEEQVDRTPNAIAVVDGKERFSYSALNSMANRVARGLITQGVRQEAIVGVRLERSVAMIAAMLGILKAGGAYLPLDTQYPEERLRFMIEDSGCAFVLSNPSTFAEVGDEPDRDPALAIAPSNLAYVIYTSGSTGRPKGVAIEHHSTVSFLHWGRGTFPPEVLRGTLAATSISFDLSVFEIFLPLICGHSVILAKDIVALPSLPAAAEVTLVTTVPSAAAALLAAKGIPATLRAINLAGEPLSTRLVDRLYAQTAVADVNDLYGPTETTTYSTWNRRLPGRSATIGRPVANTRVYLVDASLHLVPDGFPGELLIAGEGVARGYLGRPELTAEKFVSLAHLGEQGRAYRTGDLCRYTSEGALEYLGRMDSQVKVRGFRIEAGEVEAALLSHPSVREAVVMTHAEDGTGATLVGAVVLQDAHTLDVPALIAHQSRTLPAYMVAGNIVAVEEFPRTANGKIDRKQLTSLPIARPAKEAVAKPRDPLEKELADIWREGFSISNVGIDDDFFQLGGHSLLALRIFSEIEAKLGHRMMLSVLFQAPTIRQLAEHIRRERPA
jgi:amino acid adenylation domain-containing protein